jgi:type IV secretory pathway VirJ component
MKRIVVGLFFSLLISPVLAQTTSPVATQSPTPPKLDTGLFGDSKILRPQGDARGVIFLFSGDQGWGQTEETTAQVLATAGAFVVEVDLKVYSDELNKTDGDCLYLISDVEGISYQLQREAGSQTYRSPIIAGFGTGGALVLAMSQQTPAATVSRALAIDPTTPPTFAKPMCGLDRDLPEVGVETVEARFTEAATKAGRDYVASLIKRDMDIDLEDSTDDPGKIVVSMLSEELEVEPPSKDRLDNLPLEELPTDKPSDTIAIVYSGDGGWRDLDKTIAENFQKHGMPTVGIDSLRYFWSEKAPATVAKDLQLIIDTYTSRWKAQKVMLVGYSFGADILPETYNLLPAATRAKIRQISLLGFAAQGSFEISVAGWLGGDSGDSRPALKQIERIDPKLIQCFYGKEEDDSACPKLDKTKVELIAIDGGHHFDGDYDALADKILAGLKTR